MAQLVIEKDKIFYNLLMQLDSEKGSDNGFSEKDLLEKLNENRQHSAYFSTYYSLDDYIKNSLRLKRLGKKDGKLHLTGKGKDYAEKLKRK